MTSCDPIPVLIIAHDRAAYLARALASLVAQDDETGRTVIVSQDGSDHGVTDLLRDYGGRVHRLQHLEPAPDYARPGANGPSGELAKLFAKWPGYFRIAQHYRWALSRVFDGMALDRVIVLEDDLEIACDFFAYFRACMPLLDRDPTVWTISAWNDNGYRHLDGDPRRLFRSDFFPGLGWLMTRALWSELGSGWPPAFWDDWMRLPEQRKGRATIVPEVCRTFNFGRIGTSEAAFFDDHLQAIAINEEAVDFAALDLRHLVGSRYDDELDVAIAGAQTTDIGRIDAEPRHGDYRIVFGGANSFAEIGGYFGLMTEVRSGLLRGSYRGIVAFRYQGRRVYLVPLTYLTSRPKP